jgi:hypothetical protein
MENYINEFVLTFSQFIHPDDKINSDYLIHENLIIMIFTFCKENIKEKLDINFLLRCREYGHNILYQQDTIIIIKENIESNFVYTGMHPEASIILNQMFKLKK